MLALLALLAAGAATAGCGGSTRRDATTASAKGVYGTSYLVTVYRPDHGFVDSTDARIHCGPPGSGADACGPVQYGWTQTATLNATPQAGYGFQTWAGSCATAGACVLDTKQNGADKYVIAVFAVLGEVGHPTYTSPALHGPAYLDLLGNAPGALNCATSRCHGANLQGAGVAPDCFACHAQAGWAAWQTSCSFCHGARSAASKAGYVLAEHAAWSAPPDAVSQRLDGVAVPARTGAHQAHLTGASSSGAVMAAPFRCETCHAVPTSLAHVRGSSARANVALAGAGQGQLPAVLGTYDAARGTCATSCHGLQGSPAWDAGPVGCDACHGFPPATPHPTIAARASACSPCHPSTVKPDGTIDASPTGTHVNGKLDIIGGGACDACHGFPPAKGAHAKHDGLTTASNDPSGYGDVRILQDRVTGAVTPAAAPAVYAFGCGNCHPRDPAKHMDGTVEIELHDALADAASLKVRAAPGAAYDPVAKTCSGTYCHSSGQAAPASVTTPGWNSGTHLACDGCHANPPRYDSGAPGSATANSHVNLSTGGYEYGHFLGLPGPWHPTTSQHGGHLSSGEDAAPITCQTCHADTTDPSNTGPSGFYYLDTSGTYQLPGGAAARVGTDWYDRLQCTFCHAPGNPAAPIGAGRVLPLRHVNGSRDVVFDPRATLVDIPWLPAEPNKPTAPYWMTSASKQQPWPSDVAFDGTTVSFGVGAITYDKATKTCSNVACHLAEKPVWGTRDGASQCTACHGGRQ